MGTTHAAVGLTVASTLLWLAPELATPAALAAVAGGLFPDLDLFVGDHRRTLHYPLYYWLVATPALGIAAVFSGPASVAPAFFLLSAALHSSVDVLGAGHELRPWERTSDRAVYLHATGRWLRARRVVRYDGAPEDLLLTAVFSLPGLVWFDGVVRAVTAAGLALALGYALVRKRLPPYVERFVD